MPHREDEIEQVEVYEESGEDDFKLVTVDGAVEQIVPPEDTAASESVYKHDWTESDTAWAESHDSPGTATWDKLHPPALVEGDYGRMDDEFPFNFE